VTHRNFVRTQTADPVLVGDAAIVVSSAVSPFVMPPEDGILTITDSVETPTRFEIITYIGISPNGNGTYTLNTVLKGVEGTIDQGWPAGSVILQALTAGETEDFAKKSILLADDGDITINGGTF